jgi:hypothetical protein
LKNSDQSNKIKDLLRLDIKRATLNVGDYVLCVRDSLATGKKTTITKDLKYKVMRMVGRDTYGCSMSIGVKDDDGIQRTFTQSFFNVVD